MMDLGYRRNKLLDLHRSRNAKEAKVAGTNVK